MSTAGASGGSNSGMNLAWVFSRYARELSRPVYLRSDKSPEFMVDVVQGWFEENGVRTLDVEPGSPWQNDFVESFHGRFRDECLDWSLLHTLTEARVVVGDSRQECDQRRT